MEEATLRPLPPHPCSSHPCGPNALCSVVNGQADCACLSNMIGTAPNCRPECILSSDCPSAQACVNQRCVDPCPGSCGSNAECQVVNHSPVCSCVQGFTGNAFVDCRPVPVIGKNQLTFTLWCGASPIHQSMDLDRLFERGSVNNQNNSMYSRTGFCSG